jgi:hypothetical protein
MAEDEGQESGVRIQNKIKNIGRMAENKRQNTKDRI